jgi:hypothetical protein
VDDESKSDALIVDLYGGLTEEARFRRFMTGLADATKSHIVVLQSHDFANLSASEATFVGIDADEITRYEHEFIGENVWMERSRNDVRTGSVLDGDDYVSRKELEHTRYYNGFLRNVEIDHSVGLCAAFERARAAFLMLSRTRRFGRYDEDSMRLFRRLTPHLVNAHALRVQFDHLRAQASQATLRQRGMFLLDEHWRWVGGNHVAEQMVSAGWWRGSLKSPLDACHPITRAAWQTLQQRIAQRVVAQQVVPVRDCRGTLVAFANVHAYGAAAIGENVPCYVLFVRPLHWADTEALNAQLQQLFGLTASESALAVALRRQGDLPHAATAVGITASTARTRLQSILEKTAVHRQADLLLMIDALAETVT